LLAGLRGGVDRALRIHRIEAHYTGRLSAAQLAQVSKPRVEEHQLSCAVQGSIGPLLAALSGAGVVELDSHELSLEEVFLGLIGAGLELGAAGAVRFVSYFFYFNQSRALVPGEGLDLQATLVLLAMTAALLGAAAWAFQARDHAAGLWRRRPRPHRPAPPWGTSGAAHHLGGDPGPPAARPSHLDGCGRRHPGPDGLAVLASLAVAGSLLAAAVAHHSPKPA
jgi:hypothetical protein